MYLNRYMDLGRRYENNDRRTGDILQWMASPDYQVGMPISSHSKNVMGIDIFASDLSNNVQEKLFYFVFDCMEISKHKCFCVKLGFKGGRVKGTDTKLNELKFSGDDKWKS